MELPKTTVNLEEQGRVIAQAMHAETVRIEKNMASNAKRKESRLRNAAEKVWNRNY